MTEATTSEVRLDAHSIEPIPEQDKDSTGIQQLWIWAGANIAPINWILGALGIVLGLGLVETVLIVVLDRDSWREAPLPALPGGLTP